MSVVSLHGVRVQWRCDGLPVDPLQRFLTHFPAEGGDATRDLEVQIRPRSPTDRAERAIPPGYTPLFFHGVVQVYQGDRALLIDDGTSRALVTSGPPARMDCEIALHGPDALAPFSEALLHVALLCALRMHRLFDVHAAGVEVPRGALVLLVGDSGSGKTTTTLALLEGGLGYLGDDRVLLRREPTGTVAAWSYPRVAHATDTTLDLFPRAAAAVRGEARPDRATRKLGVDATAAYPGAYRPGGTAPALLLFPRIELGAPRTRCAPLLQAEAFGRMVSASALVMVDGVSHRDEHLACLRDVVCTTPAYEVILGRDLLNEPARVATNLEPLRTLLATRAD